MASPLKSTQEKQGIAVEAGRRRSMRVLLSIPIQVAGSTADKQDFVEEARTLVVNAHGALICLAAPVAIGQTMKLTSKVTRESRECRVVHLGNTQAGKIQVGIEFLLPSGAFWHIDFPPDDWVVPEN